MKFKEKVLSKVSLIPKGKVTTYKIIALSLGSKAFRAVGRSLNKNKYPVKIPCHRVICSDLSIGGYLDGIDKKRKLLEKECIKIKDNKIQIKNEDLFRF